MSKPKMLGRASGFVPNSKADRQRGTRTAKRWVTVGQYWNGDRLDRMEEDQRCVEKLKIADKFLKGVKNEKETIARSAI